MSMNLVFLVKDSPGYVDFPFQTPTSLTYEVLAKPTIEGKLALIKATLEDWELSKSEIEDKMSAIEALMQSKALELTLI